MRLLSLALRGLWWRRATSVSLLLVAAFTTVIAAAGPMYSSAAGDAVLQRALRVAPVGEDGTGLEFMSAQTGKPSTEALHHAVSDAFTGAAGRAYPTVVMQLSVSGRGNFSGNDTTTQLTLTDRTQFCDHVAVTHGSCVDSSDRTGFVVDGATARARGLKLGQTVVLDGTQDKVTGAAIVLRLRGIVERRDPASSYWFGKKVNPATGPLDALQAWVPQAYFDAFVAKVSDDVEAAADLTLTAGAVHTADVDVVRSAVDVATTRVKATGPNRPSASTRVNVVVDGGLTGSSRIALPVAVVVVELLALGWYLLNTLVGSAAEARGAEIALVKLRGTRTRATLVITLAEPLLLLVLAVPIGVLGASLAVKGLAPTVIGTDAQIRLGWLSWAAAAAAALGGLVAAAAGSVAVLRRGVLEQWRRTSRRPGRRAVVLEAVVVALAVAGIVELQVSGALDGGGDGGVAVLTPALVMVAGAVVASRAVSVLARLAFPATRASGAVAAFVSVRQLARRPTGRRTFGVLTVAVALMTFAVSSAAVLAQNRHDRALVDVGAPVVVHVAPDSRTEDRVRAVDDGRGQVTAVFEGSTVASTTTGVFDGPATAGASPTVLVVDPAVFGSVGYWREDFGSAPLADLMRPLTVSPPAAPTIIGKRIALDVVATTVPPSLTLAVDLTDARGNPITATLGALFEGTRTYTSTVACTAGCEVRRIYLTRPSVETRPLVTSFTVTDLRGDGGDASSPSPRFDAVSWSPLNPTLALQTRPAETVSVGPGGVRVTIVVSGRPGDRVPGFGAAAGAVTRQPALVATGVVPGGNSNVTVQSPTNDQFPVTPSGRVDIVPRAGDRGIVLARDWARAASPSGYAALAPNEVWLAAGAPTDTIDRLRAAGAVVTGVDSADNHAQELSRQGPAFASALSIAGGVVSVVLAAAAVVLTLALLARRRIFELSAMRALGIRTPRLIASVVIEQGALVVAAAISGLLIGAAAVALALPALPAYVDHPAYPGFLVDQPLGLLLGVGAAVALVLVAAVTVSAAVLVRSAAPSRLREAEG